MLLKNLSPQSQIIIDREQDVQVAICGFGPIASAAVTSRLLCHSNFKRVVLMGIAGSYCLNSCKLGQAYVMTQVLVDGVGVGSGEGFQSAEELGWPQLAILNPATIRDKIELSQTTRLTLLSVCAASENSAHRIARLKRFADAMVEDMEGFSVALSCKLATVPCTIVRGISNQVGDRNKANWKIQTAIHAVAAWLDDNLASLIAER